MAWVLQQLLPQLVQVGLPPANCPAMVPRPAVCGAAQDPVAAADASHAAS
ncbi:hypothetical protein PAHAL_2G135800 [Panicum hallii]|nr:hypothetical protein PAHAL_2G135800 [Panicum hallii]